METETLFRLLGDQCIALKMDTAEQEHVLEATGVFRFSTKYPGFMGHFPGNPVLPAIVQLATVRYTVEHVTGNSLRLLNYSKTKFRGIVRPDDVVEVWVRIEEQNGRFGGSFSLSVKRDKPETVATGNYLFSED